MSRISRALAATKARRLPRKLSSLLAAGMMAAGVTAAAAAPAGATTPPGYFQITTSVTDQVTGSTPLCLQGDLGGPMGSSVTQQSCDTTGTDPQQQWQPISLGGVQYKFRNAGTGLCLEARFGAVSGKSVALWDCSSTESNTRWQWTPVGVPAFPNIAPIQSRVSGSTGYCLDVPGASTAVNIQMQLFRCNNTNAQYFLISYFL
jgi:hypothetical protein